MLINYTVGRDEITKSQFFWGVDMELYMPRFLILS